MLILEIAAGIVLAVVFLALLPYVLPCLIWAVCVITLVVGSLVFVALAAYFILDTGALNLNSTGSSPQHVPASDGEVWFALLAVWVPLIWLFIRWLRLPKLKEPKGFRSFGTEPEREKLRVSGR